MAYFYHLTREQYLYGSRGIISIGLSSHRGRLRTSTGMKYGSTYITDQEQRGNQEKNRIRSLIYHILGKYPNLVDFNLNFEKMKKFYSYNIGGRFYKQIEGMLRCHMASVNIGENPDSSRGKVKAEDIALRYAFQWAEEVGKILLNNSIFTPVQVEKKGSKLKLPTNKPKKINLKSVKELCWLEELYKNKMHPLVIIGKWWALADYYAEQVICARQTYVFMGEENDIINKLIGYHSMSNPNKVARPIIRGEVAHKFNFVPDRQESSAFTTLKTIEPHELEIALWHAATKQDFDKLSWMPLADLKDQIE